MDWSRYYKWFNVNAYHHHIRSWSGFCDAVDGYTEGQRRILEVGTGSGMMSCYLAGKATVTAVDNSPGIIDAARALAAKLDKKVNWVLGDGFTLPFLDNAFDSVFHQGLLEHFKVDEMKQLIAEALRVAPILIFSVPTSQGKEPTIKDEHHRPFDWWAGFLSHYEVVMQRKHTAEEHFMAAITLSQKPLL